MSSELRWLSGLSSGVRTEPASARALTARGPKRLSIDPQRYMLFTV